MTDILIRAGCFVGIIVLGFVLRQVGVFRKEDFPLLATLALKITLPAAAVVSFSSKTLDPSYLILILVALIWGILYMAFGALLYRREGRRGMAFGIVNLPSYNIGCFALPFIQGFLGPVGVMATSLFDSGNAIVCLGGSYGIASMVQSGERFSPRRLIVSLSKSPAFLTYMIMVILTLLKIRLPGPVIQFASILGSANTAIAMLMLGVGFRLELNVKHVTRILRHLAVRYAFGLVFALVAWFLLPFDHEIRQVLALLAFSPIGSAAPGFTSDLGGDTELSSTLNSLSILVSVPAMVAILLITS